MWTGKYETTTNVPAQRLFEVICDVNHWNKWDSGLEYAELEGAAVEGASFMLKPKGAPIIGMSIDAVKPFIFVDTAHLLLAKMRTTHEYVQSGSDTRILFKIEITGLLGFLWRRALGEKQIEEAPAQMVAFIAYARGSVNSLRHTA